MDVKEAVRTAKHWVLDVMSDEKPANVGLEEVEFSDETKEWKITLGFSRPWNSPAGPLASMGINTEKRLYRTIIVDDEDGEVKGMRRRNTFED